MLADAPGAEERIEGSGTDEGAVAATAAGTEPAETAPTVEHPLVEAAGLPAPSAEPRPEPRAAATGTGLDTLHAHAPGFATADTPLPGTTPLPDAEDFVERAIESVLEQVPDVADEEPEGSAKLQPWAETAAPPSKNKRPLSELLEQYAARVAAAPDAVAGRPRGQHPIAAFFARFTPQGGGGRSGGDGGAGQGGRNRRRRGRRGAEGGPAVPAAQAQPSQQGRQRAPQDQRQQRQDPRQQRQPQDQRQPRQGQDQRQQRPAASAAAGGTEAQRRSRRRGRRRGRGGGGGGAPAAS